MKKLQLIAVIVSSLVILIACGPKTTTDTSAKGLSKKYCENCHGNEIKELGLSKDEILKVIKNGDKGMEANILKGEDAEKVSEYLSK